MDGFPKFMSTKMPDCLIPPRINFGVRVQYLLLPFKINLVNTFVNDVSTHPVVEV